MVFLKFKNSESDQFIHETRTDLDLDQVIRDLVRIYNKRLQLTALISETEELLKYGVMTKTIEEVHESSSSSASSSASTTKDTHHAADPSMRRAGGPPKDERIVATMNKTIEEAKFYLSPGYTLQKKSLTLEGLEQMIQNIRGAIMIAYPMGLPSHDSISFILSDHFSHGDMYNADDGSTTLWFAGKELQRGQKLQDYKSIGRNEKTMIIVKLAKKGSGPPAREPPLTEEMQRNLMAYYYKKQEEQKKLLEDSDDTYVNSVWADPKGLKNHFQGINNVDWK